MWAPRVGECKGPQCPLGSWTDPGLWVVTGGSLGPGAALFPASCFPHLVFFLLPEMVQCDFHAAQIKQIHIYSLPSRPHVQASQILIWELLERQIYL